MKTKVVHLFIAFALVLSGMAQSFAKDKGLTAEEVVAAHLKSIGDPGLLGKIKNRGMSGKSSMEFVQGGVGNLAGSSMVITAGNNLSIILKYGGLDYPGEQFAFDGTEVEVANISPGQRSPLGDFIFRYKGVMREGLLGGVWSLGWPLLDIGKRTPSLKYASTRTDGRDLHELEYTPKGGLNNIKVKLFFEPDTFRHVKTEYTLVVQGEQALQAGQTVTRGVPNAAKMASGQGSVAISRNAGIQDQIGDSHYRLVERFDNFKEVRFKDTTGNETRSLVLPHSYMLEYSVEGQGSSFLGHWSLTAEQWMQNGNINPAMFKVH